MALEYTKKLKYKDNCRSYITIFVIQRQIPELSAAIPQNADTSKRRPTAPTHLQVFLPFCWRGGSGGHMGNHGIIHVNERPRRAEIDNVCWMLGYRKTE